MEDTGLMMKYFVLSPHSKDDLHRNASHEAMLAYAEFIYPENPQLSQEIREWVSDIRTKELMQ